MRRAGLRLLRATLVAATLAVAGQGAAQAQASADEGLGVTLPPVPAATARSSAAASAAAPRARAASAAGAATAAGAANAAAANLGLDLRLPSGAADAAETSNAVRIVLGLTLLAVLPSLLVCMTAFLRIIIVLSMLRHAIGMPETPPNTALIGLAIFLTLFTMAPMLQALNRDALQPFLQGQIGTEAAYTKASQPLREFMGRQTREQDIALMIDLSKSPRPQSLDDVSTVQLIPAFMLSELRAAFQIGFVVFLPFLLIDLIVSSVLMALGMMMMPPITVALPLKLLMFILVDGWSLILKALVGSFH
jgi:flagellar biosynthetic protein FliP